MSWALVQLKPMTLILDAQCTDYSSPINTYGVEVENTPTPYAILNAAARCYSTVLLHDAGNMLSTEQGAIEPGQ